MVFHDLPVFLSRFSELSGLETTVTCLLHDIQLLDDDGWSLGVSVSVSVSALLLSAGGCPSAHRPLEDGNTGTSSTVQYHGS